MALDSLGVQTVQVLDSIGALDSVLESIIEKIEASTFLTTTDDDDIDGFGRHRGTRVQTRKNLGRSATQVQCESGSEFGIGDATDAIGPELHRAQPSASAW